MPIKPDNKALHTVWKWAWSAWYSSNVYHVTDEMMIIMYCCSTCMMQKSDITSAILLFICKFIINPIAKATKWYKYIYIYGLLIEKHLVQKIFWRLCTLNHFGSTYGRRYHGESSSQLRIQIFHYLAELPTTLQSSKLGNFEVFRLHISDCECPIIFCLHKG